MPRLPIDSNREAYTPAATATFYKWWVVFLLWFVCFFNYADRQAINSVFPLLEQQFSFDNVQIGLIGSAFAWVYAFFAMPAGLVADRFSRKAVIVVACIVWSIFTLATAWCDNLPTFIIVRSLTGMGETLYFPAAMSLLSDYHDRRTRSSAMSWHQSAVYIGTILGSWMAALLAERFGWQCPFYLFGPCGIALAIVLATFVREPRREAAQKAANTDALSRPTLPTNRSATREPASPSGTAASAVEHQSLTTSASIGIILRTPTAVLLMAAFFLANFVAVIFLTWTPTFLVKKFAFSLGSAGLTGTLYIHIASAAAVPLAGYLADRLTRRYKTGRMLVQFGSLIVGAGFVALVGLAEDMTTLIVAMVFFGVCKGGYDSGIFASLFDCVEPRARGAAAGIMNTVGWCGGALGPLFVGLATKYGNQPTDWQNMSQAIVWCGAIYLAGAACLFAAIALFMKRPNSPMP